jgi:hypothetical protein
LLVAAFRFGLRPALGGAAEKLFDFISHGCT